MPFTKTCRRESSRSLVGGWCLAVFPLGQVIFNLSISDLDEVIGCLLSKSAVAVKLCGMLCCLSEGSQHAEGAIYSQGPAGGLQVAVFP